MGAAAIGKTQRQLPFFFFFFSHIRTRSHGKISKSFGEKKDIYLQGRCIAIHLFLAERFNILSIIDFSLYLFMVNLLSKYKICSRCLHLIGACCLIFFFFSFFFSRWGETLTPSLRVLLPGFSFFLSRGAIN